MSELKITDRRKAGLLAVQASRVEYDPARALYLVDGAAVDNWDRRTFAELRRAGLIEPVQLTDQRIQRPVTLTGDGRIAVQRETVVAEEDDQAGE
jgi:hypothetical protein